MKTDTKFDWRAFSLAWKMGYTIAIPLVLLALGGRLLDKALSSSPIFLLIGIVLSMIISSIGIWRITKPIMESYEKPEPKSDTEKHTNE